jgi:hypothetical protein
MKLNTKTMIAFGLGFLTFALAAFLVKVFLPTKIPDKDGIIEDWGQICLWQDVDGIYLSISPLGCYSSNCTEIKQHAGTAVIDLHNQEILLDAIFVLKQRSPWPLPCVENCSGGGLILFKFEQLVPKDYRLNYKGEVIGEVNIFSGRATPRQCFTNVQDQPGRKK